MILLLYNQMSAPYLSPESRPIYISGRVFKYIFFFKDCVKFVLKSPDLSFLYLVSCMWPYIDHNHIRINIQSPGEISAP